MNKLDFVLKQLARTSKKRYESYAINRIWHRLNNSDIKITTQQYVRRKGNYSLTDLYFPQLKLHIEIDEQFHERNLTQDELREADVIEATNHEIKRVKVCENIDEFDRQIDKVVLLVRQKVKKALEVNGFEAWDPINEFNPLFYAEKGYLEVSENPAFRRIVDAANCLGNNAKSYQQAFIKSKVYENYHLWFPKFYQNKGWENSTSDDGKFIYEKPMEKAKLSQHLEKLKKTNTRRIVFPRVIDNLGFVLYRFKGVFELDLDRSNLENGAVYRQVATRFEINQSPNDL